MTGCPLLQNLPFDIQISHLENSLSEWGHIVSTKIPAPKPGKDSVVAYVQFGSQEAADNVIEKAGLGLIEIGNSIISASPYLPYEQRVQSRNEEFTNLYVKNLPEDVRSNDDLRALFLPYGAIKSARLDVVRLWAHEDLHTINWSAAHTTMMQDMSLGHRYGFVNMCTYKDAKSALKGMHGIILRNSTKPLYVARFRSKAERQVERQTQPAEPYFYSPFPMRPMPDTSLNREGRNLYVKHLAADVDEMALFSIFQVCKAHILATDCPSNQQEK